ncbi:MAG: hypothetical protein JWP58_429, partial [Hymenobacter sp.]|nr:hypothetical protein [Hymenobacter sp.]
LLTFTRIKKGVYEEALPAIIDMATKLGGDGEADLKGATIQVGKALNDPIKGITALGKAGVSFSEDQKTMIKSLVETGDVAGAQAIILGELKTEFAGSAEAAAKAGTGPLKQFQIQIGNVKEGLGELIVDGLQAIQPVLAAGVGLLAFFIELLKGTPAFLSENKAALVGLGVAIVTLNAEQLILNGLVLYQAVVEKGRAAATIASATAQRLLNSAMTANPIGLVIAAVALLVGGFITLYDRSEKVREVIAGLGATAKSVFASIKDIVVNQLGSVATLLAGIFTFNPALIKQGLAELGPVLGKAGTDAAAAYHQGYATQEQKEQAAQAARASQQRAELTKKAQEAAKKTAEEELKASRESLKNREANIKAALALVAAGSAEELRLKKLAITTKRDIDLLDEKKTAGDKKVIRAEALRDLRQLQDDFDKKGQAAAEKRAKEQADVQKRIADLKAGLLTDETEKRIQQLTAAAEKEKAQAAGSAAQIAEQRRLIEQKLTADIAAERKKQADAVAAVDAEIEKQRTALIVDGYERRAAQLLAAAADSAKVKGTDAQVAEQRRLIQEKLQRDLVQLEQDRVEQQREIAARILAIDEDIALRRIERRRQHAAGYSQEAAQADADEYAIRRAQLDERYGQELFQEGLTNAEKLAISRRYLDEKEALEDEYGQRGLERRKAEAALGLEIAGQVVQTLADFQKIGSDKELAKIDKDKKARLTKLEAEYKAGTVSKEQYEQQKSNIEANYDAKTRSIKKEAAEKEKQYNIAQAIIATALAVVKALPNPFLATAAGITGALATAKIIATPIPEFARGGVVGAPRPTWREKVRRFVNGGSINPVAGVPSVGQLHSNDGIQMIDGKTGEHLGEWERGEPYMILSRDTYANNRELVDELLDTSLNRGGAPVRRRDGGHYADGGTPGGALPAATGSATAGNDALLQVARETRDAVLALPSRQRIDWGNEDTANVEDALADREDVRERSRIR